MNHDAREPCSACAYSVAWNEPLCPRCARPLDPPNVRYARAHRPALLGRSAAARRVSPGAATALESALSASRATVSMPPKVAVHLLTDDQALYQAYHGMVAGAGRRPAAPVNDLVRSKVEMGLYGTHGIGNIRYGALSLDGRGLRSYGLVCAALHEDAVCNRATVLSGNSYEVVGNLPAVEPMPAGVLSGWADRAELVVAGSAVGLSANPDAEALKRAVLFSEGRRDTDRFYEVHLWGPFNGDSVEEWTVLGPATDPGDRDLLDFAADKAAARKARWNP